MKPLFKNLTTDWALAVLLFVFAILLYSTLPLYYPIESSIRVDSLDYALRAESPTPSPSWFHPHHLLSCAFYGSIWQLLGGTSQSLRVIWLMHWGAHLASGLTIALLFLLARRMRAAKPLVFLLGLIYMVGYTPWTVGSFAEVVATSNAIFFATVLGLFYRKNGSLPSLTTTIALGALYGVGITWHQVLAIYLPALLLGMAGWGKDKRLTRMLGFVLGVGVWAVGSYLVVFFIINRDRGLDNLWQFATLYAQGDSSWGRGGMNSIILSLETFLSNECFDPFDMHRQFGSLLATSLASLATLMLFVGGLWGWIFRSVPGRDWRKDRGWALATMVTGFLFINWWCADCRYFWLLPWVLIILGCARFFQARICLKYLILACMLTVIGLANILFVVGPRLPAQTYPPFAVHTGVMSLPAKYRQHLCVSDWELGAYLRYWNGVERVDIIPLEKDERLSFGNNERLLGVIKESWENRQALLLDEPLWDKARVLASDDMRYYNRLVVTGQYEQDEYRIYLIYY